MNSEEFLTPEELTALTGYERANKQIDWLRLSGWRHIVNAKGLPIVSRAYCRQKLSDSTPETPVVGQWQPDFSALMA